MHYRAWRNLPYKLSHLPSRMPLNTWDFKVQILLWTFFAFFSCLSGDAFALLGCPDLGASLIFVLGVANGHWESFFIGHHGEIWAMKNLFFRSSISAHALSARPAVINKMTVFPPLIYHWCTPASLFFGASCLVPAADTSLLLTAEEHR